jgi:hypothetical protein
MLRIRYRVIEFARKLLIPSSAGTIQWNRSRQALFNRRLSQGSKRVCGCNFGIKS